MKRWVVGDIHGNYKGLVQALERSKFDYQNDLLITLGDIVDGWADVYECVEELLKIKNRIDIIGNHDEWFLTYFNTGVHPTEFRQGGKGTMNSYLRQIGREGMYVDSLWSGFQTSLNPGDIPETHKKFFRNQVLYTTVDNMCFVHGGFDREYLIGDQHPSVLYWDRNLWLQAQSCKGKQKLKTADDFEHIFIGHTFCGGKHNPDFLPLTKGGVTNLDTGSGWSGKLTLMNIDNRKEFYQSDNVITLYPNEEGRN